MAFKVKMKGWGAWLCLASLLYLGGCGGGGADDRPKTVPVSGTVTYNNQPVEGATVSFMAKGAPRAASGVTDKEGKFKLSTFDPDDGAVLGEHTVTISKVEAGSVPTSKGSEPPSAEDLTNETEEYVKKMEENKDAGPKSLLPAKYADANVTPLREKVTESGPNSFVFNLAD